MASAPISIKLRCASWQQLASIYKRDLARNAIFLRSAKPPPIGTPVRIDLTLPSESMVVLTGAIDRHVGDGELDGRGPGVDVRLTAIPQSAMWLIETALASARKDGSAVTPPPVAAARAPAADAALGDGDDIASAERELIAALGSELEALRRLNPFQVLGLGYEPNDLEVRAAFGELTKRYHPDRYARYASPELRELAAEIFILIRDAYRRLHDDGGRAQARGQLARAPRADRTPPPARSPARTPPSGVRVSTAATSLPAARQPAPAPRAPTPPPVVQTVATPAPAPAPAPPAPAPLPSGADAREPDHAAAEALIDAGRLDEATAHYRMLARRAPNDRAARAGLELVEGLRALAAHDRMEAAQRFEAVLELDPANERAARELAEMRRLATNERKGMLSRLLGKKE